MDELSAKLSAIAGVSDQKQKTEQYKMLLSQLNETEALIAFVNHSKDNLMSNSKRHNLILTHVQCSLTRFPWL